MQHKTFHRLSAALCALALVVIVAGDAAAQGRNRSRYNKSQVDNIIRELEVSSDDFRRDFDRALDQSRRDGTQGEDTFNERVKRFEDAVDRLRGDFDRRNDWWESRNDVQRMLEAARPVSVMMTNRRFRGDVEAQWRRMRRNINRLAETYELPRV